MSQATRRAIYGALAGDTTLNALLGTPAPNYTKAIYYEVAPESAEFAFVIFQKQAGTPTYALADVALNDEVWTVKGVGKDSQLATGMDAAEQIAARVDFLLSDGTISIAGAGERYLRRESDVDYSEVSDGVAYRHAGAMYRLVLEPS